MPAEFEVCYLVNVSGDHRLAQINELCISSSFTLVAVDQHCVFTFSRMLPEFLSDAMLEMFS